MQVETGVNKWTGRVPPLDLSNVSVCPKETEQRWHKMHSNAKKIHDSKKGTDGLPIGEFCLFEMIICVYFMQRLYL